MCTCMKCGHEWLENRNGTCLCPECGTRIEIKDTKERVIRDKSYFNVITTIEDYQVVRMFLMMVEMRKGMKASPAYLEIGQYFIDSKGNKTIVGLQRTIGYYVDSFAFGSPLEIRGDNEAYNHIADQWVYPRIKVTDTIKRNGFKGSCHHIHPVALFQQLLTNPKAETLMKSGEIELLRYLCNHPQEIDKYWNSIKIAKRNGYEVKDARMWFDYIKMLNPLVRYLHSLFDANAGVEIPDIVETICKRYCVGTSSRYGGSTVFWQFDQYGKVRSGQIIGYDSATGKRDHNKQNWVHSVMSDKYPNFDLRQCFFGSHLIRKADKIFDALNKEREAMNISGKVEPIIWLMESPKAALILAVALMWEGCDYSFVPMATMGCGGINLTPDKWRDLYDKHQVLRNRKVVLFPDQGKFDEWKSKGEKLKGFCKEVWISTVMEGFHPHPIDCEIQGGDGFDDIIIRYVQQGKPIWDVIGHCYGYLGQNRIV